MEHLSSSISNFSCDFTILSRLTSIDISFNSLSSLPPLPQCLQILKVSHNHLTGKKSTLNDIHLNDFRYLALEFYHNMTNLRAIHASFNKIEHVSDSIKRFDKLQSLRLNDNCIAKMPNLTQVCYFLFILLMNPSGKTHPWKLFVQNRVMTKTDFWKTHPFLVMGRVFN